MKRTLLLILSLLLLTAQAEEIDSPLVHVEDMPLAVDISPVITFQTDEAGVFAVVVLSSTEVLPTPAPPSPAPSEEPEMEEVEEEIGEAEPEETVEAVPASFLVTTHSTPHSITYTFTPIQPEQGENH